MNKSESIVKVAGALLRAQKKMDTVSKDASNPFYKSKYADINSFLEVAVEALNSEGISVLQPAYSDTSGHFVETTLLHETGEYISSKPLRLELSKIDMQQLGSAITYGRRYQLQSLLGMRAEDDDAESTMGRSKPAYKQTPKANLVAKAEEIEKTLAPEHKKEVVELGKEPPQSQTFFRGRKPVETGANVSAVKLPENNSW